MPLEFRDVHFQAGDLSLAVDLSFGDGTMIGLTGPNGSGKSLLLQLAAGALKPQSGEIEAGQPALFVSPTVFSADPRSIRGSLEAALVTEAEVVLIGPSFVLTDFEFQGRLMAQLHELRRKGSIIVLACNDLALLERHCDEVVVLENGQVVDRGDPEVVLMRYRQRTLQAQRAAANPAELRPSSRHGDERAAVVDVQLVGPDEKPTTMVASGDAVSARVRMRFREAVENPVVGILIRSRIGVNVYGTNTEMENVNIGPCNAGDEVELSFSFPMNLCPQEYTLTVASHDPDGTAHDWLEDAIFFTVTDTRYTAGVANLHAKVAVNRN